MPSAGLEPSVSRSKQKEVTVCGQSESLHSLQAHVLSTQRRTHSRTHCRKDQAGVYTEGHHETRPQSSAKGDDSLGKKSLHSETQDSPRVALCSSKSFPTNRLT